MTIDYRKYLFILLLAVALCPLSALAEIKIVPVPKTVLRSLNPLEHSWQDGTAEWRLEVGEDGTIYPYIRTIVIGRRVGANGEILLSDPSSINHVFVFKHPTIWFEPDENDIKAGKILFNWYREADDEWEVVHCASRIKRYYLIDKATNDAIPLKGLEAEEDITHLEEQIEDAEGRFAFESRYVIEPERCELSAKIVEDQGNDNRKYIQPEICIE